MRKLLEDNKLATDNNLGMYYSGGGCYHLSYDTNIRQSILVDKRYFG
jgi:hypothetical protein